MSNYVTLSHNVVHLKITQHCKIIYIKKKKSVSNHLTANIWTQGIWCGVTTLFKTFRIIFIGIVFAETEKSLVISKCHIISQRTTAESTPAVTFPGPCLLWHVNMYSPKGTHYIPYSLLSWWWVSQKDTVTQPPLPPQLLSRGWGTKPGSMSPGRMRD